MRQESKNSSATVTSPRTNQARSWFDTPWYYVSIAYGGSQIGLMVATDDAEEAWREAEQLCTSFDNLAKPFSISKVVIQ